MAAPFVVKGNVLVFLISNYRHYYQARLEYHFFASFLSTRAPDDGSMITEKIVGCLAQEELLKTKKNTHERVESGVENENSKNNNKKKTS